MYTARGHAPPTDEDKFGSTPNAVGRAAWPFEDERARLGWARNDESKDATGMRSRIGRVFFNRAVGE